MSTRGPNDNLCEGPETPVSTGLKSEAVAEMLGLSNETLTNWRMTDVGPPYIKLSRSNAGRVRYQRAEVLAWQRRVRRVVPAGWPCNEVGAEADANKPLEWYPAKKAAQALGIAIPTLTAWTKRRIGIPFMFIGERGTHEVMYDRRDVESLAETVRSNPALMPVIPKKQSPTAGWTPEQRKAYER